MYTDHSKIKYLTHKEFIEKFQKKEVDIIFKKGVIDILHSIYFNKIDKIAFIFWSYISIGFVIILPIIFLFFKKYWIYIIGSIFIGIMIYRANKKSLNQAILHALVENEKFWVEMIFSGILLIKDENNEIILPPRDLAEKIVSEIKEIVNKRNHGRTGI